MAGSAASILIDVDKFMIPQKEIISQTAFYAVAVFIATVVEIPGRAMFQIVNPLVAKALYENNERSLSLTKEFTESFWYCFLLINLNVDLFIISIHSNPVVLIISISK